MTRQKPRSGLEHAGMRNPTTGALWARPLWRVVRALSVIVPVVFVTVLPADVRADDLFKTLQKALTQPSSKSGQSPQQPQRTQPASLGGSAGPAKEYSQADLTANGMNIMGVKLGMSLEEAITVLRAKNISVTQRKTVLQYPKVKADYVTGRQTDPYEYACVTLEAGNPRVEPHDSIVIDLTPEATPRVYSISRTVNLGNDVALYAPWEQAVMEKYGQPMSGGGIKIKHATGGDFVWAKAPVDPSCRTAGIGITMPSNENALKTVAERVDKCSPWTLWINATGPDPYVKFYRLYLSSNGIADTVTRDLAVKVAAHTQGREAAEAQRTKELSDKKPDL
jgi:hypothetical protein